MKPKRIDIKKVINILMHISKFVTIALSFLAGMLTLLALGENFYIQLYVDGYKPAEFTIKELKFYKSTTSQSGLRTRTTSATYLAFGEIAGNKEKFGLKGFTKGRLIQSQSDLEKEFSVGQKLQVLYNPNISKKLKVHIQYPETDFKKIHKHWQMQMIKYTYGPWIISFFLFVFLGILTKSIPDIILVALTSIFFMGMSWLFVLFNLSTMSDNFAMMLSKLFRS